VDQRLTIAVALTLHTWAQQRSARKWQTAIRNRGTAITFTLDQGGGVTVAINMDPQWEPWGQWLPDTNTIQIKVTTIAIATEQNNLFDQRIFLHEIGEFLNYDHVYASWGCLPDSSVMFEGVTEDQARTGQFATSLTSWDLRALTRDYGSPRAPDLPPDPGGCRVGEDCTPLILNLGKGALQLTAPDVPFDFLGDGAVKLFSWTSPDSDAAFLVLDRDGNGTVDCGKELFGNATPLSWNVEGDRAADGFSALAWFDQPEQGGNADGMISSEDAVYNHLRLWIDRNHNGVSEVSELLPLAVVGVDDIDLTPRTSLHTDRYGNLYRWRAPFVLSEADKNGVVRFAYDVVLVTKDPNQ
jgi:hypothetical protein